MLQLVQYGPKCLLRTLHGGDLDDVIDGGKTGPAADGAPSQRLSRARRASQRESDAMSTG